MFQGFIPKCLGFKKSKAFEVFKNQEFEVSRNQNLRILRYLGFKELSV
jgi:hypothetical protein